MLDYFLLQTLRTVSPTSLKVTKHLLDLGANFTLGECLQMEYRLVVHFVEDSDFKEGTIVRANDSPFNNTTIIISFSGVSALLIRKDNSPKWNPSTIEDVTEDRVRSFFRPLPNNEELPM